MVDIMEVNLTNSLRSNQQIEAHHQQHNLFLDSSNGNIEKANYDIDQAKSILNTFQDPIREVEERGVNEKREYSSLLDAVNANDLEAAERMIAQFSEIDLWNQLHKRLPSVLLVSERAIRVFKDGGAQIEYRWEEVGEETGMTAIHVALSRGYTDLAILLLSHGADPHTYHRQVWGVPMDGNKKDVRNNYGLRGNGEYECFYPLYWAIVTKNEKLVQMLLSKNVDLKKVYEKVVTRNFQIMRSPVSSLDIAVEFGTEKITQMILSKMQNR